MIGQLPRSTWCCAAAPRDSLAPVSEDDECIHLNNPALCSICNGRDAAAKRTVRRAAAPAPKKVTTSKTKPTSSTPGRRVTRTVVATQSSDTEESVEQYRSRYAGDREPTFEAYVEVFFNTDARDFPGGWLAFSRCANAEPERKETAPALVRRAELLMRDAGYVADESGTFAGGRRWRYDA